MKGSDGPFVRIRGLGKRYGSVEALAQAVLRLPYHLPKRPANMEGDANREVPRDGGPLARCLWRKNSRMGTSARFKNRGV